MKRLLSGALLLCGLLWAAELSLTETPATDSRYFWTYDGYREPILNRNLAGNAISVGGSVFERGISGHTPFGMTYCLNKTADSITAFAGLEDEDHPKDAVYSELSIFVIVLADGKEVFRREHFWKAPPLRLEIDLRGVHQLELRAESGKGKSTHRHRVAFGNPQFHTGRPEELLRNLAAARTERDAALYRQLPPPRLPDWRQYETALLDDGTFRVSNRDCEAIFAPNAGGRLIRFARKGGENLLGAPLPNDPRQKLKQGRAADFGGGHFLRHLPRDYFLPGDPMHEHAFYETEFPAEGVVVLRSAPSAVYLTQLEYRFEFPPAGAALKLTGSVINCAPFPRNLGVWSLTRVDVANAKTVETNDAAFDLTNPFELTLLGTALTARFAGGDRLRIRYEAEQLQIFYGRKLLELEGLSPIHPVPPGGKVSLTEHWRIDSE